MRVHDFVNQPGQFETAVISWARRSFGFPSVIPPQVGDLFVTDRPGAKVCYQIESVSGSTVYDHARGGLPEIRYYRGVMRDVVESQTWTAEMSKVLREAGLR